MKKNGTKILMSVTTLALMGASLASAQDLSQTSQTSQSGFGQKMMQSLTNAQKAVLQQAKTLLESGKKSEADALLTSNGIQIPKKGERHGVNGKGMHKDGSQRKAMEEAIIAGNFTTFQTLASTSPLKSVDQATFNLLTPQFVAKKNAEDQIRTILKNAGIAEPTRGDNK